ncbi:MAG TPA: DUF4157 domain-containing protein [Longimicrobium sp.]
MRVALQRPHPTHTARSFSPRGRLPAAALPSPARVPGPASRAGAAGGAAATLAPAPGPVLQRCACGGTCPRCRAAAADHAAAPPGVHEVLRSGGEPLPADTRSFMESRFAHDFSAVRVHTGARAAETAREMDARAFTVGRDVVFGPGEYAPHTPSGRHLLAHELAHTIQQRSLSTPPLQTALRVDGPGDASEHAAARAADAVMGGGPAPALAPVSAGVVQRQRRRTCTRGAEADGVTTVTCDDNSEYRVRRVVIEGLVPETRVSGTGGMDDGGVVFLEVEICRDTNRAVIRTSMPVGPPIQRVIENLLRGAPAASGVQLTPEIEVSFDLGGFRPRVSAGAILEQGSDPGATGRVHIPIGGGNEVTAGGTLDPGRPGEPRTGRVDIDVRGPIGRPPPRPRCVRVERTVTFRCAEVTHTAEVPPVLEDDVEVYVFFEYATATPTGDLVYRRGSLPLPSATLSEMAHRGYRVREVYGYTSPEGPRSASRRRGGFMGNDALGQARADVAAARVRTECPQCVTGEFAVLTRSELYTGDQPGGRGELERDPLTRRATEGFLGRDDGTPDPLATERDQEELERRSLAEQRDYVYPRLRRAVIHLHRTGVAGQPSRPVVGGQGMCPEDVIQVVR